RRRESGNKTRRHRPQTRLARRALVEGCRRASPILTHRPLVARARTRTEVRMRLIFERKPVKFAAARLAGTLAPGRGAAGVALEIKAKEPPPLPGRERRTP